MLKERIENETELNVAGGAPSKDAPMFVVDGCPASPVGPALGGMVPGLVLREPAAALDNRVVVTEIEKVHSGTQGVGTIIG